MESNVNVAEIAAILAEPSRAAMLVALLDGRMHPASELAFMARIKPQTASFHLGKMLTSSVVTLQRQGRHHYYQMNPDVAGTLETLLSISPMIPVQSLRESTQARAVKKARTCYDHFAGEFGVALTESLLQKGIISEEITDFQLTEQGSAFFTDFGVDLVALRRKRRAFTKKCLDWSERKHHLAGSLGYGIVIKFQELGWVEAMPGSRAIKVTEEGKRGLQEYFEMQMG
ncbi:ArsR/SmtB family transcription factor [Paenibacillus sp. TAB 01]|uniref:ArsR/SmtB family transcription factor n=1 Tax=Paenibacillus sp. TAB 01 TaxID=3368988 RepID=UPI0037507186